MRREDDVLVTVAEAAAILEVNPATVWRYIKAEDLKPAREKKPYMLWQSDVVAFSEMPKKRPGPKRGSKRRRTISYRQPGEHRGGHILRAVAEAPASD